MPEARSALERAVEGLALDPALSAELRGVAAYLAELEDRLGGLSRNQHGPAGPDVAREELASLVRETEAAADAILSATETMLAQSRQGGPGLEAVVRREAVAVLEACGFQDITGQRVSKVSRILRDLDAGLSEVAKLGPFAAAPREESAEERRARELILHGPASAGPELTQDDVDALFR